MSAFQKLLSMLNQPLFNFQQLSLKTTLLFLLFLILWAPNSHAQIIQDDFEGNGSIDTWFGDDCSLNIARINPHSESINTSATVLEYHDVGGLFANVRFDLSTTLDLSNNHEFSFKIYVPSTGITGGQNNQVSLKLQNNTLNEPWTTQSEIIKPLVLDQWQIISFDFASDNYINLDPNSPHPVLRDDFNRVLIQLNGENNNDQVLAYIDDFSFDSEETVEPVYDLLIWSDEFDTDGPIDDSKWFHQTQLPLPCSWFNNEIQHYTNRTDNAVVENGTLKIKAKKETFTDQNCTKQYTSARLNSKFAFTYGKVEVRAKLPFGVGTWPAIWLLGKNINENGAYWDNQGFGTTSWPACGEIDIMEHWGTNQNYVQSAMHTPSSFGATVNHGGQFIPTVSNQFHIYTLEWTPEKMIFAVDDVVHYVYEPEVQDANTWPFDADQYILLNIAIQDVIDPNFTESSMDIDYIRIYQQSNPVSTQELDDASKLSYFPNPVTSELTVILPDATTQNAGEVTSNIYSLDGKLLSSQQGVAMGKQLQVKGWNALEQGIYILKIQAGQQRYSLKVVKK